MRKFFSALMAGVTFLFARGALAVTNMEEAVTAIQEELGGYVPIVVAALVVIAVAVIIIWAIPKVVTMIKRGFSAR